MADGTDKAFADVPAGHGCMAIMGERGDSKLQWNPAVKSEVDAARLQFAHLINNGYAAFKLSPGNGGEYEQVRAFDAQAERYIMAPQMVGG